MFNGFKYFTFLLVISSSMFNSEASFKRCFKCRSRGELGSCKDPFAFNNASALDDVNRVEAVPCTSGWCGKKTEKGTNLYKDDEYGAATERFCLQRAPQDGEERCAPTIIQHEKVYMCFCQGDLCNSSTNIILNKFLPFCFLSLILLR